MEKIKTTISKLQPYLVGNLFKTVVFASVACLVVVGNFLAERGSANIFDTPVVELTSFNYDSDNDVPLNGVVRFASEDEFAFDNSILVEAYDGGGKLLKVKSGKFWSNFAISDASINLLLGNVVLLPDHAVFDVAYDGSRLTLNVFDGDVYLAFLKDDLVLTGYQDPYSSLLKNKIVISKGMQVDLSVDKVLDERILYSKLAKEFKLSPIAGDVLATDWVSSNIKKDILFIESIKNDAFSSIRNKGVSVYDGFVGGFVFDLKNVFTFVPEKQHKVLYDGIFSHLDDAIYYTSVDNLEESDASFTNFETRPIVDLVDSDEYWDRVDGYVTFLSIFDLEDPEYKVLLKLLDYKLKNNRDVLKVMGFLMRGVYNSVDIDKEFLLIDAVNLYFKNFEATYKVLEKKDFFPEYLAYNNQFFDNLFAKYPAFYKGDFMVKKRDLIELNLLKLYLADENLDADELKNHFIDRKIVFLSRLQNFFFDEKLSIVEAKDLLKILFSDVNALMPEGSSNLAVVALFEQRLATIADFWGYLNSPEYYASRSYGATHKLRYEVYKDEKPFVATVLGLRDAVLGEDVDTKLSDEDVKQAVKDVFMAVDGVTEFSVGEISDIAQRQIPVKGVIEGYPFEAIYDRDQESVKDVYVYGELVVDRPAKIASLLPLFKDKFADLNEAKMVQDEKATGTYAERFARMYVASILNDKGFDVTIDNVLVVDKLNAVYRISDVSASGGEQVVLTFDLDMNKEMASNLFLSVKGEPLVLNGEYTLDELYDIAISGGEFSGGVRR